LLINLGASGLSAYPDEQIGYLATEQYASRSVSAPNTLSKLHSNVSQPAVESPLRKTSFPSDDAAHADFKKSKGSVSGRSDDVVDSEQDDDIIHVDDPKHHYNKITGGQETIREKEDVQPYVTHPTEENGLVDEYGYSVPILASDEVAREVGGEDMQPAVPPTPDRRGSAYDLEFRGSGDITPSSRPVSRPSSIHGGIHGVPPSLSRFTSRLDDYREEMHTPLEDVDEYEPLFPDEDGKKKGVSPAERFKRPDTLKHRFPSQDIWEDTPSSAMHVATVSTPDVPSQIEQPKEAPSSTIFESPEAEAARKEKPTEEEKKKRIPNEERLANSKFAPLLRGDMQKRPGLAPRFPSQDIWEETPDSQYLVTTVSSQQEEETTSTEEASTSKPAVPPRPGKSRLGEGASSAQIQPSVPPRPEKKVHAVPPADAKLSEISTSTTSKDEKAPLPMELRKVPSVPDRPKPQVPARPGKKTSGDSLSKTVSTTSASSSGSMETEKGVPVTSPPPPVKAKPSIPPRPGQGGKIANLKGNFMNDLNQRLQLGPPKEKEPEIEAEKEVKPLEDARKGRARGPQRRAPAKSPSSSGEPAASTTEKQVRFSLSAPMTVWHINSADGSLKVHNYNEASSTKSGNVPEASESIVKADVDDGLLKMSESKVAQVEPAGESADPSSTADQATPHAELANPMDRLKEHESCDASLSQQTTASSGALSGHVLSRVRAEDHEQGSSLSKHTTASSMASGATLDRQPTLEDSNRNVAEVAVEEPKVTTPAPAPKTKEEKLAGADRPREPSGEEDITYKKLEEMTAKADGKGHSGLEPEV
jgi:Altered inheritance of mitochondria protein 21